MNGYRVCVTSGRSSRGEKRRHWVSDAAGVKGKALCGAVPRLATGNTWRTMSNQAVTCPRCLAVAARLLAA